MDKGLHELPRGQYVPLVLAGLDYYIPIYRAANTYPRLVGEAVTNNFQDARPEEIHARAWPLVRPLFERPLRTAVGRDQ